LSPFCFRRGSRQSSVGVRVQLGCMVKLAKKTSRAGKCSQCMAPPAPAKYCPRCGKPIGNFAWVSIESKEITIGRNETKRALDIVFVRVFSVSTDQVTGTWRIENEVQRQFDLKLGETVEWEIHDDTEYCLEITSGEPQTPLNTVFHLKLLDRSSDSKEVTFLVQRLGRFKRKK
jgi:hypothetical protein